MTYWSLAAAVSALTFPLAAATAEPAAPASAKPAVSAQPADNPVDNPVADPKAVVLFGHARFTVLTPQLIRMEWSGSNQFEDHASFVFINRRLPAPKFGHSVMGMNGGRQLTIRTSALELTYYLAGPPESDTKGFTPENLSIKLTVDGKQVTWHPGMPNAENLLGTTRTLDGAYG